jgi:hypothetical protein
MNRRVATVASITAMVASVFALSCDFSSQRPGILLSQQHTEAVWGASCSSKIGPSVACNQTAACFNAPNNCGAESCAGTCQDDNVAYSNPESGNTFDANEPDLNCGQQMNGVTCQQAGGGCTCFGGMPNGVQCNAQYQTSDYSACLGS